MACGKPIVATSAGGIPEIVVDGETGLLVRPRDHAGMARAIVTLLKDPALRQRMGKAGLARARKHFSAERMVAETLQIYQRLAAPAVACTRERGGLSPSSRLIPRGCQRTAAKPDLHPEV